GQQITLNSTNAATVAPRIALLNSQAPGNSDLVVKGTLGGEQRGWYKAANGFRSDRRTQPPLTDIALQALAATPGQDLTYTAVPPGSGVQIGVDRDGDDYFDGDERDAGTDPTDAGSTPCGSPPGIAQAKTSISKNADPPGDERLSIRGQATLAGSPNPIANG